MKKINKKGGKYNPRNRLNSLTGSQWLSLSTSIWYSNSKEYPFVSRKDIKKLLSLFSKDRSNVLIKNLNPLLLPPREKRNYIREIPKTKSIDYAIANCTFSHKGDVNLSRYISKLKNIIDFSKKLKERLKKNKYLTIFINEFQIGRETINSTFHITSLMKRFGFRFKGKTNLIFENSNALFPYNSKISFKNRNVYLMHFKNNGKIRKNIETVTESIKNSLSKRKRRKLTVKEEPKKIISNVKKSVVKMDKIGKIHPAPFSPEDLIFLIKIFTKEGDIVLDPFVGVGSTLISCIDTKRRGIGIDLNPYYIELAKRRIGNRLFGPDTKLICGNSLKEVKKIKNIQYCITSPPYHNILKRKGMGIRHDNSQTRQGIKYYSNKKEDLGNQETFEDYLNLLKKVMRDVYRNMEKGKFCSIVISDFTVDKIEKNVIGYLIESLQNLNFKYCGTLILTQDQKSIYPFGYPYDFVINHTNQYVVTFRR